MSQHKSPGRKHLRNLQRGTHDGSKPHNQFWHARQLKRKLAKLAAA